MELEQEVGEEQPCGMVVDTELGNLGIEVGSGKWSLFIDGSSTKNGSGVGLVLKTPEETFIELAIRLGF